MNWHDISAPDAVKLLKSNMESGLSETEASKRLESYGENIIVGKRPPGVIRRFLSQFSDFMVLILLAAAAVSFVTAVINGDGDFVDPVMILLIVVLNAIIGTVQECRAERAIDALKKLSAPHARVLRSGKTVSIPSSSVVRGDILLIEAGDFVCADARLIKAESLRSDESSLTGEAVPAVKRAETILPSECAPGDRENMIFSSCYITSGHGRAVVVETGMDTQVGKIAKMLDEGDAPDTPLQKSLSKTGKILGIGALAICALIFALGLLQRIPAQEMFMISISLAVAAIPEGLPAIVTIVLALGVRKLAARRAVVRNLPAVETLGSATVICSDKTGTLTQNKMTVEELSAGGKSISAHSPEGRLLLSGAALCCNAVYDKASGRVTGEPTEAAIVRAAANAGQDKSILEKSFRRIKEIPFDSKSKKMTVICSLPQGGYRIIVKGAPDVLISLCTMSRTEAGRIKSENDRMASKAMRVIAAAYRDMSYMPTEKDTERELVFCGLIGMTDPPRPQAYGAVAQCKKAGIRTVMITGDHILTAGATAKKLGILSDSDAAMSGAELDRLSDRELISRIGKISVFARVSPEHKVRIVKAFQSRGDIVAMTGDGVNDAPALRCADIGCAMGKSGTDVAKSAADMVLTDDNFATIVNAVEQGRGIFDNIRRSIHFLLSSNIGEILTVLCAFLMRLPPPLLAIQLLWVNLITDSLPALALGAEPASEDIMERPPTDSRRGIFGKGPAFSIIIEGCFIGGLAFLAYTIGRVFFDGCSEEPVVGRTMTFAVLSISQLVHSFNLRSEHSLFHTGIMGNPKLIGAFLIGVILQSGVISIPPLAAIFGTCPLSPVCWMIVAALSLVPLIVVETEKRFTLA